LERKSSLSLNIIYSIRRKV